MKGFGIFRISDLSGDRYAVGWLTGPEFDLVAVKPEINTLHEAKTAIKPGKPEPVDGAAGFRVGLGEECGGGVGGVD